MKLSIIVCVLNENKTIEKILQKIDDISFVQLDERDVIRHRLVKKIIKAFNKPKKEKK